MTVNQRRTVDQSVSDSFGHESMTVNAGHTSVLAMSLEAKGLVEIGGRPR